MPWTVQQPERFAVGHVDPFSTTQTSDVPVPPSPVTFVEPPPSPPVVPPWQLASSHAPKASSSFWHCALDPVPQFAKHAVSSQPHLAMQLMNDAQLPPATSPEAQSGPSAAVACALHFDWTHADSPEFSLDVGLLLAHAKVVLDAPLLELHATSGAAKASKTTVKLRTPIIETSSLPDGGRWTHPLRTYLSESPEQAAVHHPHFARFLLHAAIG
jgi:hypothetical protein